jgi:hypothetical protein
VTTAYDLVRPSYEFLERRYESVQNRARGFLTVATALMVGTPTLAKAAIAQPDFSSPWFVIGLAFLVLSSVVALVVQIGQWLRFVDLARVYEQTLRMTDWQFRRQMLETAKNDLQENRKRVSREGIAADVAGGLVLLGALSMAVWLTGTPFPCR